MVEIKGKESLEAWLRTQPKKVAMLIAARAALRAIPHLSGLPDSWKKKKNNRLPISLLPPLLYGVQIPWIFASVQGHGITKITVNAIAQLVNESSSASQNLSAKPAGAAAYSVARAVGLLANNGNFSFRVAARCAEFSAIAVGAFDTEMWTCISTDIVILKNEGFSTLVAAPLWPEDKMPYWADEAWRLFRNELLEKNSGFDVWIIWYEERLKGKPVDKDEQLIRSGMKTGWFGDGADEYNFELKRRLREAGKWVGSYEDTFRAPNLPEPILKQGTQLWPTPSGLDIVESEIPAAERTDQQIATLHQNILRRVRRLDGVIARLDNSHRLLTDEYRDFVAFVSNDLPDINVATVWSVGSALTEIIDRYEAKRQSAITAGRNTESLELPDEQIFGQLVQLSRDFSAFILAFDEGRTLLQRARDMRMERTASQSQTSNVLKPMLTASGLFAEQAKRLLTAVDRALDIADDRTTTLASASIGLATNSLIAIGRVAHKHWKPVVAASVVIGAPIDIMHKLAGDPNWEVTRAAMQYLTQNANALYAFANHDPVMRRWLEWTIEQVNIAIEAEAKATWPDGLELQRKLRDEWER